MKMLDFAADTDLGKQRKDNQDVFICKQLWSDDQGLIGVIDGVGGYIGGEIAARIAQECIEFYMSTPKGDALSMLKEAVVLANNQINEAREKDPQLLQMCCVLTVAVADAKNQLLYYVHVGDTRLYHYRKGQLEKITKDHSLVGVREDAGTLTEEEAMHHPRRNVILRQVGSEHHRIDDPEFLEFGEIPFLPGDQLLICSDGLSDMVMKDQIVGVFKEQAKLSAAVSELISLANKAGGQDNITIVIARSLSRQKRIVQPAIITKPIVELPVKAAASPAAFIKNVPVTVISSILFGAILLFLAFWFFAEKTPAPQKTGVTEKDTLQPIAIVDTGISRSPNNSSQAVSHISSIDSLILFVTEHGGRELLLEKAARDTVQLSQTIGLGKITRLTGGKTHALLLMPDPVTKTNCAIAINGADKIKAKKDTVFLKNLIIDGFETGIHVEGHVVIRLDNVIFRKVEQTVSYQAIDSTRTGYLVF